MYMTNTAGTELDLFVEILSNPSLSVVNTTTTFKKLALFGFSFTHTIVAKSFSAHSPTVPIMLHIPTRNNTIMDLF